jgi:hypothetical protein
MELLTDFMSELVSDGELMLARCLFLESPFRTKVFGQKVFGQKVFGQKVFGHKAYCRLFLDKKLLGQKVFGQKECTGRLFMGKKVFGQKVFGQKLYVQKVFEVKSFHTNFQPINHRRKITLSPWRTFLGLIAPKKILQHFCLTPIKFCPPKLIDQIDST